MKDKPLTLGFTPAPGVPAGARAGRGDRAKAPPSASAPIRYENDVYGWALQQCELLKDRSFDQLDLDHLIEEVGDVARRELAALTSDLRIVLLHLLKWDHQPERRSRSWELSIQEHRARIQDLLSDSPSLGSRLADAVRRGYRGGRSEAAQQTGLPLGTFPGQCPYSWADIMDREIVHVEPPEA